MVASRADKAQRCFAAAISTCLVVAPFYAFIGSLADLEPSILRPCNEGCTFIRFWGNDDLPNTAPESMAPNQTGKYPVFVTIRNGEKGITFNKPDRYSRVPLGYTNTMLRLSKFCYGAGRLISAFSPYDVLLDFDSGTFLSPHCEGRDASEVRKECQKASMKGRLQNHMSKRSSVTLQLYLASILAWGGLRLIHDWTVISETVPEVTSLVVGYVSAIPQIFAVAMGFLWCIGAAEVFEARDDAMKCACYYQLATIPMLVLIGTPVGLYMATRDKVWKLGYATLHGDYLYTVSYDVPYRSAVQSNSDPTYGFISNRGVVGSGAHARHRGLTVGTYKALGMFYPQIRNAFNAAALFFVYAFAFPTLTVRFYDVVIVGVLEGSLLFEKVIAVMVGIVLALAPDYVILKQLPRALALMDLVMAERARLRGCHRVRLFFSAYNIILDFAKLFTSILFALLSFRLLVLFGDGREITAETAGWVGAGGFFLFVAVLSAWVPSDTPIDEVMLAIQIKGGALPMNGLNGIISRGDKPHLGLSEEAEAAEEFAANQGKGRDIVEHGHGLKNEDYEEWVNFLSSRCDDKKDPFAPAVGRAA